MTTPTTISEQIEQSAIAGIASASNGQQQATAKSIDELIKADQYLKGQTAQDRNHLGMRFRKIVPGGCG